MDKQDEIYNRFEKGGFLWFIERTDTNQYYYVKMLFKTTHQHIEPDEYIGWSDTINLIVLSGAFLTEEDAEKHNNFTQGGCRHCGNNSEKIPTIITKHEFVY